MKLIDLLNKLANGEEVPKEIKWGTHTFELWENSYINYEETKKIGKCSVYKSLEDYLSFSTMDLNDEVEIIEDTPKKIEKLTDQNLDPNCLNVSGIIFRNKINEIIDYINKERNND